MGFLKYLKTCIRTKIATAVNCNYNGNLITVDEARESTSPQQHRVREIRQVSN